MITDSNPDGLSHNQPDDLNTGITEELTTGQNSAETEPSRAGEIDVRMIDGVPESTEDRWKRLLTVWQMRFCLALRSHGTIGQACRLTKVSRASVYRYRDQSPTFRACILEALEASVDAIEGALYRTATVGDMEPIYQGGELVGYRKKKDVRAAEILLKAKRPSEYRGDYEVPKVSTLLMASAEQVAEVVRNLSPALSAKPIAGRVVETEKVSGKSEQP